MDFRDYDTRLAAYALILDEHDRVLLARWNEGDQPRWTMPGGGVEFDETPAEGAVRELQEETGYDVELLGLLGVDTHLVRAGDRLDPPGRPMKSLRLVYDARIVGGELRNEVDGTTDEARWIPLSQVPSLSRVSLVDAALALRSERI
ncbi:NUDIX hydrolase [Nocardioides sp.]|uniref:NUDIX hydrolase n=1 Tax=Nocardioides sp. TaxID=35761 RepID=UPI002D808429|nr:NUDIX domain-containing protein [Nocardioides sp.]HET8959982.1 NUDIX domain-containing protein [Nocardioides sp.]